MTKKFLEEQFKAHLKEHNTSFEKYLHYNKHRDKGYYDFNQLLEYNPYCLLINAFRWFDTKEGSQFWCDINSSWHNIYNAYIKDFIPYYFTNEIDLHDD